MKKLNKEDLFILFNEKEDRYFICDKTDFDWYKECIETGKSCNECGCCTMDDGTTLHAEIYAARDLVNNTYLFIPIDDRIGDTSLDTEFEYKVFDNKEITQFQIDNYFKRNINNDTDDSIDYGYYYEEPCTDRFFIAEIKEDINYMDDEIISANICGGLE